VTVVSSSAAPLLGGRYQILKHLASGGMAELYLARAQGIAGFERYVVVKRIRHEHSRDQRFVQMFLDEARLAAQLHHQHIGQVYDIGEDDGTYYFTMEYVHGENVRELLHKVALLGRQVPLEHALTVVAAAAAGLHYAHEKRGADRQPLGIVHRDVSPSNLLVAYDGAVKVVDFGIAKAAVRMSETRSGTLKGKIAYMSPEQCTGRAVDRRSDVFALGIIAYELTTVTRLFKGDNDYITMNRIATGEVPPPSTKRADYPRGLEAIVMKALALDPAQRYQSAGEMLAAIEALAVSERVALSPLALGRYLRELFGERPEPWLELGDGDDIGVIEISGGSVSLPRAQGTGASGAVAAVASAVPSAGTPASQGSLVLATSSRPSTVGPAARRSVGWIIGGGAVVAAVVGAFFLGQGRGGGDGEARPPVQAPATEPAAVAPPPAVVAPPPAVVAPTPPPLAPAVAPPEAIDAGTPPAAAVAAPPEPEPAPKRSRDRRSSGPRRDHGKKAAPADAGPHLDPSDILPPKD